MTDLKHTKRQKQPAALVDRLPPHSPEAEQGVLGCILLSPPDTLPECISAFKEGKEIFYDLRHQEIYATMLELFEDGEAIDVITLQERLKCWNKLEQVGGIPYLSSLPDVVPSAANISYYNDIVREKWIMRKMLAACAQAVGQIYDAEGTDFDELLDQVEKDLLSVSETRVKSSELTIQSLVHEALHEMETSAQHHNSISGIATGFLDYDKLTDGMHPGEMIVIAARPSVGKSSLAMNIVEHVACELHLPVGVMHLEMTGKEFVKRMICARAKVNIRDVKDGFIAQAAISKLTTASGNILNAPIYIDDSSGVSIMQIRAKARRWWQQHQIKLLVIDYLQLANAMGGKRKFESRQQEVSDISIGCKTLAKELNIPVLVLSQLNRDVERDKNRKPRLADLRESGAIEQDADVVGFLYRPGPKDDNEENETETEIEHAYRVNWLIAKQRNGANNVDVPLTFLRGYTRFVSTTHTPAEEEEHHEPQQQAGLPYV